MASSSRMLLRFSILPFLSALFLLLLPLLAPHLILLPLGLETLSLPLFHLLLVLCNDVVVELNGLDVIAAKEALFNFAEFA